MAVQPLQRQPVPQLEAADLGFLSPRKRAVYSMARAGWSTPSIAQAMGVSKQAISVILHELAEKPWRQRPCPTCGHLPDLPARNGEEPVMT